MSLLCYPLFLFYLLNMFRATMCPSSGADDCVIFFPRVGIVPWLQEGCQDRLADSVSIEEFVARYCYEPNLFNLEFLKSLTSNFGGDTRHETGESAATKAYVPTAHLQPRIQF